MNKKAFTLIELLVVVLIIGILSAVALPQYQKAVLKARLYQGIPLVESIYQAQQAYYLANGTFATDFDSLDVSAPLEGCQDDGNAYTAKYTCSYGAIMLNYGFSNVQFIDSTGAITYMHFLKENPSFNNEPGDRYCSTKPDNQRAREICQSMGGTYAWENANWAHYKLN
ncbi:MAG: prepilin-type N-terminal cleavage/methylation domain-containing protein [Elusimicrobiaceae bacterium]|nr:prepilin-type N-terminal cleavage/methylation domain-containing protein [Elusimicrobiaceae bacterium]